jgi:sugar O-acyltransferase (sialic acid O-acetyltransferase NeuD family)
MAKVVLFGNGEIASVAYAYLTHDSPHEVVAFTVDRAYLETGPERLFDLPVVAFEEIQDRFPPGEHAMFVSISYRKVNKLRAEKYAEAKAKGYELISYVSSKAITWPDLKIGDNCFIFEENVIQPFVEIGNDVILWSGNHIGHHTVIKDHCFLASHVVISGHVTVEPNCFFGVNATVRDGITIARECVIGAGALILKPTQEREVYVGTAATLLPRTSDQLRNI